MKQRTLLTVIEQQGLTILKLQEQAKRSQAELRAMILLYNELLMRGSY